MPLYWKVNDIKVEMHLSYSSCLSFCVCINLPNSEIFLVIPILSVIQICIYKHWWRKVWCEHCTGRWMIKVQLTFGYLGLTCVCIFLVIDSGISGQADGNLYPNTKYIWSEQHTGKLSDNWVTTGKYKIGLLFSPGLLRLACVSENRPNFEVFLIIDWFCNFHCFRGCALFTLTVSGFIILKQRTPQFWPPGLVVGG